MGLVYETSPHTLSRIAPEGSWRMSVLLPDQTLTLPEPSVMKFTPKGFQCQS